MYKLANKENQQGMSTYLKDTFSNRRSWIKNTAPPVETIIKEYPRLVDYDGQMVIIIISKFRLLL